MASDEFTKTVSPSGGYSLVYTVLKSGFVSLKVIAPNALLVEINNASSFDTALVLSDTVSDLSSLISRNDAEIRNIQSSISEQQAIINNPSSTSQQKAAAQVAINNYNNSIGNLQNENLQYSNIITYVLRRGPSDFFELVLAAKNSVQPSPNPPTPTITQGTETAPPATSTNTLPPAASDDSGTEQATSPTASPTVPGTSAPAQGGITESPVTNAPGTSQRTDDETNNVLGAAGEPKYENEGFIKASINKNSRPGRRLENPLSYLASYTYQLSMYMISPDAYEAFVASGRKNIFQFNEATAGATDTSEDAPKGGIYLIAQSAGMGAPENRATGFGLDYYIDSLSFESIIATKSQSSPVANTGYRFKIVEPYGFSFVTKLRNAQKTLIEQSGGVGTGKYVENGNPTKMFYILGIRFFGYDQAGNIIKGDDTFNGNQLDPSAAGSTALFETYYDIVITEFKFKIDGTATTYDIRAETASVSSTINQTKGTIPTAKTVSGSTVRDLLSGPNGLITQLNKDQAALVQNKTAEFPIVYGIQWLGDDAETIALSKVTTPNKNKKSNQAGSTAETTAQSNTSSEVTATPNKNIFKYTTGKGIPITQEIEEIISQSTYMTDALSKSYKDTDENDPKTKSAPSTEGAGKKITWFNITPKITNIKWDKKRKDWVFNITYVLQTYLIPQVESPYADKTDDYYGPHKRYDYWYTGKNTEILAYEQKIDNQYFTSLLDDPESDTSSEGNASNNPGQGGKNGVNMESAANKEGARSTQSKEAVNSFRTSLYDPGSFATAKIQILGDPDFMLHDAASASASGENSIDSAYDKFYETDGYTINATGGQVFVEIDFKEAIDYSRDSIIDVDEEGRGVTGAPGTLAINDSIEFWRYPEDMGSKIKGISYQVLTVNNSFQSGGFKQTLNMVINPGAAPEAASEEAQEEVDANEEAATNPTGTLTDESTDGDGASTGATGDAAVTSPEPNS